MYTPPLELFKTIGDAVKEQLDYNNFDNLKKQLSYIQSVRYELSWNRCMWHEKLMKEKNRLLIPKDKEFTELDRKTMLDSSISNIEADYEFMLELEKIIDSYLELGIVFLQG